MNKVTPGNRLTTEIDGLVHSTNYTVEVFGVDEVGQPYKTPTVNSSTKKSKKLNLWFQLFFFSLSSSLFNYHCFHCILTSL